VHGGTIEVRANQHGVAECAAAVFVEVVNATKTSNGSTMGSLSAVDLSTDGDSVVKHDCEEGGSVEKDQIAMMALRMSRNRHVTKEAWNGSRSCERHAYGQAGVVDVHVHGDNGCSQTE